MDAKNSMVIARGKGRWGEEEDSKRRINVDRRLDLGW